MSLVGTCAGPGTKAALPATYLPLLCGLLLAACTPAFGPASGFATPAVYEVAGRQFVVVAAGGGKLGRKPGSKFVAFALPKAAEP